MVELEQRRGSEKWGNEKSGEIKTNIKSVGKLKRRRNSSNKKGGGLEQ